MGPFHEESCKDFEEFLSKAIKLTKEWWIFRGQQDVTWVLKHTFERTCDRFNVAGQRRPRIEEKMIREFQRRLHHYTQNIPGNDSIDEWMALMQHYGAPTRLLDFTYSPYVAAYFAFEFAEPDSNIAIWAVNAGWFSEHLKDIPETLARKYRTYVNTRKGKDFKSIFMKKRPKKLVLTVNPFRLNERLAYQRGVFLCPGNVEVSLMDNLSNYTGNNALENKVVKFIMPAGPNNKNTIDVLEKLDIMNISRTTLFPGLDGFAQSFGPRTISLFDKQ